MSASAGTTSEQSQFFNRDINPIYCAFCAILIHSCLAAWQLGHGIEAPRFGRGAVAWDECQAISVGTLIFLRHCLRELHAYSHGVPKRDASLSKMRSPILRGESGRQHDCVMTKERRRQHRI